MTKKKTNYAELKAELEAIMSKLQSNDIDVDTALALHEQAEALIAELEKHLEAAKNVVEQRIASAKEEPTKGADA